METCCGCGYGLARKSHSLTRIFKGRRERTGQRKSRTALRSHHPYLGANPFQGLDLLTEKRKLFPGLPSASPSWFALPHWIPKDQSPCPGSGLLTRFPFGLCGAFPFVFANAPASERTSPFPKDRLTHVQLLFTWNPSPLQSSRFSLEYLLLPPRSAPAAAPGGLTPDTFHAHRSGPPTRCSLAPPFCVRLPAAAGDRLDTRAPSIFGASCFGR